MLLYFYKFDFKNNTIIIKKCLSYYLKELFPIPIILI